MIVYDPFLTETAMKLHLPLGLLMAVLAATSVTEAKMFTSKKNITSYWERGDGCIHLSLEEAIGSPLKPEMQWALDVRLLDTRSYTTVLSSLTDGSQNADAQNFKITFYPYNNQIDIQGYGWTGVTSFAGALMGGNITGFFSLVHMGGVTPSGQQALDAELYGVWPANSLSSTDNPVGFYPRGKVSQDGGSVEGEAGAMWNATTGATGPGSNWAGITDLYGFYGDPTNPRGWWTTYVTYSYDADEDNSYTIKLKVIVVCFKTIKWKTKMETKSYRLNK